MIRWILSTLMVVSLIATSITPATSFAVPIHPKTVSFAVARTQNKVISTLGMAGDDDGDFATVPIRRRRQRGFRDDDDEAYNKYDEDEDEDDEDYDDEDDDEDDDEYGLFSDVVIDNPILDSIDPDGAAERFPELASDPKFWIDMVLFLIILDFISWVGPRNPFPDLPWYNTTPLQI